MIAAGSATGRLSPAEKRSLLSGLLEERRVQRSNRGGRKLRPVSFSQRRLWFLDQLAPGSSFYNVDFMVPLPEALQADEDSFERALTEVVRRHESLRTIFEPVDGEPMQVILPPAKVRAERLDLRHLSLSDQNSEVFRLGNAQLAQPFDLARGPLMRVTLIRRLDGLMMILVMHHIICDGWSMGVFWREFVAIHEAFRAGLPSPLPPPAFQYADFAMWQRDRFQGEVLEEELSYWRRKLDSLPPLTLPYDRARLPVQTFRGAGKPIFIPKKLIESLKTIGEREGATLFMTLLAAFKILLSRYSGQEDFAVGTYIANRNRAEVEEIIGFFVNTLVLRTSLGGNPSFRDALARVKETALGAYAHQDMPFETLVEVLQPERDLGRNPLFQVIFQLFNAPNVEQASDSDDQSGPQVEKRTATFDLAFNLWETPDGLGGAVEYSTDLFDALTIERMASHYRNLLESIVRDPTRTVQDLQLLSGEESHRAIVEWNATAAVPYGDGTVVDLFRGRVALDPDGVALIAGETRVTYRELAERVAKLAKTLEKNRLIGICLERSIEAVVAMFAVLDAGSAFVPMDPAHPAERREYIARDAGLCGILGKPGFETTPFEPAWQDGLAYAIYTSGSTGKPKGVAVEHGHILNRLWWMWREYPFAEREVACLKTSLTFVESIWEILGPLLQGTPIVVVPENVSRDPEELLNLLAVHGVTRLWLVPSLLREMVLRLESETELRSRLADLRFW